MRNTLIGRPAGRVSMPFKRETRPSLYCVELRTSRWEEMVDWYRHAMGLRVLVRVVEDGYALIEAGETRISILARAADQAGEASPRWSMGFEVDDLAKAARRLRDLGVEFSPPRGHAEGFQEIVASDPDGNAVRLFAWPDRA